MGWLGGLLGAAFSKQLVDEFKAWTPPFTKWLIRRAASLLPPDQRERYEEEWLSHDNEVPGEIARIAHAVGCFRAAPCMRRILSRDGLQKSLNIVGGTIIVIFFAPMLLVSAVVILVTSGRPVLYKTKVFKDPSGDEFAVWRFRVAEVVPTFRGTHCPSVPVFPLAAGHPRLPRS
jgi:hypothetical protein